MDTPETAATPTPSALETRVSAINVATNGLYKAVMTVLAKADAKEEVPPEFMKLAEDTATHALTLLNCGLIALTEIADASQRLATLGEVDLSAELEAMANAKAEDIANAKNAELSKRGFIGRRTKTD